MNLTVSVIIDSYNYARFLRQAIDSALNQTYPHCEVVVVDDGSTDESGDIIRSYGTRIKAVLKKNGGQASAFNAGFVNAAGDIIMLLDSDDYLAQEAAERIVSVWNSEVNIVHHQPQSVDSGGKKIGPSPQSNAPSSGDVMSLLLRDGGYSAPASASGLAYSRSLLQKLLPMPEEDFRICADTWLIFQAPFLAPVTVVNETLAFYRHHDANSWAVTTALRLASRRRIEHLVKFLDAGQSLIRKQAEERDIKIGDTSRWQTSYMLRYKLILVRLGSSVVRSQKGSLLVLSIFKKLLSERLSVLERLRNGLLSLTIWLGPLFVLRWIFPNIFNKPRTDAAP